MTTISTPREAKSWLEGKLGTCWEEGREGAAWGVCVPPEDAHNDVIFAYGMDIVEAVNNAIGQMNVR